MAEADPLFLPNGSLLSIRRARRDDVGELTALYHDAYSVWKEQGLRFGPMYQSEASTAAQLEGRVYVAAETDGRLAGSFALDENGAALLEYLDVPHSVPAGRLLSFKKAAVVRRRARSGLGARLYERAEEIGRAEAFRGMILETVEDARWLVEWYRRLGFTTLGSYRYPDMKIDTVLMVKLF